MPMPKELVRIVYIGEDEDVIAYCSRCESVIYKGSSFAPMSAEVLKERVLDHEDFFEEPHLVDIIFPREGGEKIFDGEDFFSPEGLFLKRDVPGLRPS